MEAINTNSATKQLKNGTAEKRATSFTVHGFMTERLGLSGAELYVFALIYSFAGDGIGTFYGSREYISECVGCTVRTVDRALKRLVEKGYVIKLSQSARSTYNYTISPSLAERQNVLCDDHSAETSPCQNVSIPETKCRPHSDKMSPNNKDDNKEIINTTTSTTSKDARGARDVNLKNSFSDEENGWLRTNAPSFFPATRASERLAENRDYERRSAARGDEYYDVLSFDPYGHSMMTKAQYDHLEEITDYETLRLYISRYVGLVESEGKRAHSAYRTILRWIREDFSVEGETHR